MITNYTLEDAYDNIRRIQEICNIDAFVFEGINVWPVVRDLLFVSVYTRARKFLYNKSLDQQSHTPPSEAVTILYRDLLEKCASLSAEDYVHYALIAESSALNFMKDRQALDSVFFAPQTDDDTVYEQKLFNKVADSTIKRLQLAQQSLKLCPLPSKLPLYKTNHHTAYIYIKDIVPTLQDSSELEEAVKTVCAQSEKLKIPHYTDVATLCREIREIFQHAAAYKAFLKKANPQRVILSSYVNKERRSMIVAARQLGIPAIDIEHGFMGPLSPYALLDKTPRSMPSLLPDVFWCWGKDSQRMIQRALGKNPYHRAIVSGSPWHGFAHDHREGLTLAPSVKLRSGKKMILVALQPDLVIHTGTPRVLPDHLSEVMIQMGDEYSWLIRLHPRSQHMVSLYEQQLQDLGVTHFQVKAPTAILLIHLFPRVIAVLSSYSTVAFEANSALLPVGILDSIGVKMCARYIRSGSFSRADSAQRLKRFLKYAAKGKKTRPAAYIQTNIEKLLEASRESFVTSQQA